MTDDQPRRATVAAMTTVNDLGRILASRGLELRISIRPGFTGAPLFRVEISNFAGDGEPVVGSSWILATAIDHALEAAR